MTKNHAKTKKTKFTALHMLIIAALAAVLAYVIPNSLAAPGTATFTIEPTSTSIVVGANQTYDLFVTPQGAEMGGGQVTVNFPSQLQYQAGSFSAGTAFGNNLVISGDTTGSSTLSLAFFTSSSTGLAAGVKGKIGSITVKGNTLVSTPVTISLTNAQAGDMATPAAMFTPVVVNATATVIPVPQADLIVTGVTWSPASLTHGTAATFTAAVRNQGTGATAAGTSHRVRFVIDGATTITATSYTSSIPVGTTVNISFNSGTTWPAVYGTNGSHSVVATVDDTNLIVESNETNNASSTTPFTVTDSVAPISSPTFPGTTSTLSSNEIIVRDLTQAVIKPTVTDNVALSGTPTYTVSYNGGTAVSATLDASNNYTFNNKNGDYAFRIRANDTAGNSLDRTITVKVRHPNIDRSADGRVNIFDVLIMRTSWSVANTEYDLDISGQVNIFDILSYIRPAWTP
jgi:CARDB